MEKSKKFRMPAGIRNKLTAAIAMLLVSSIMMVSSTYAWFTLSTAPEVTGISTSVGANGNLEMALLNSETFADLTKIASAVGDSSAVSDVEKANITWGNLVDLSAASYGLQSINLQPARLNIADGSSDTLGSFTNLLKMPVYGKDGRVSALSNETYSTVYSTTGWSFDQANQQYGVRAIGANDNLTPQQAGLIAAKAAYTSNLKSAQSVLQGALSANGNALASALTALAIKSEDTVELSAEQLSAISAMITASGSALNYIDAAYKQVLLAAAASQLSDTAAYETAAAAINGATTYQGAIEALGQLTNGVTALGELAPYITELNAQKTAVEGAETNYAAGQYTTALGALVDTSMVTINGFKSDEIMQGGVVNGDFTSAIISDGGAVVAMPDGSGVFAYVASVAGNYAASCKVNITEPVSLPNVNATMKTAATVDVIVATAMNQLEAASGTSSATVLSDTFGYALDFAFRTNAAESYLMLQTAAAQRVYSDSASAATQGAGASMTFQVTTTEAGVATLSNEQVTNLMGAIRVAFVNPVDSKILAIAALTNITEGSEGFKGDLYLHNYTVDEKGVMNLNGVKTTGPADGVDPAAIMKLNQSEAARLTVVVWLDGDMVDNADVANAAQSLVGSMNLQFSSSAELIPMQNTALQNMTITYTELSDANYAARLYSFNGAEYILKSGYKLYNGSDSTVYFSNDKTNYTKLTVMNYTTAMAPLTATIDGVKVLQPTEQTTLELTPSAGTVESITWSVANNDVIEIVTNENKTATVTAKAKGTADITIKATIKFAESVTRQVEFEVSLSVGQYWTISFNGNGAEGTMTNVTVQDGSVYTLPANGFTVAEGKTFGGWSVNGTAMQPGNIFTVTADTVVTAIWEDVATPPAEGSEEDEGEENPTPTTYTVTYVAGEGASGTVPNSVEYAENATVTVQGRGNLVKDGFTFGGWSDGNGSTYTEAETFTITADTTLTAVWTEDTSANGEEG